MVLTARVPWRLRGLCFTGEAPPLEGGPSPGECAAPGRVHALPGWPHLCSQRRGGLGGVGVGEGRAPNTADRRMADAGRPRAGDKSRLGHCPSDGCRVPEAANAPGFFACFQETEKTQSEYLRVALSVLDFTRGDRFHPSQGRILEAGTHTEPSLRKKRSQEQ